MSDFWMVVADSARVQVYEGASPVGTLSKVHEMTNERARMRDGDLVSDKPGRMHDDGKGRSATEHDATDEELDNFVREVGQYLDKRRAAGDFKSLSIVAEPRFLGKLRKELGSTTRAVIIEEVAKNISVDGPEAAQEYLSRLSS